MKSNEQDQKIVAAYVPLSQRPQVSAPVSTSPKTTKRQTFPYYKTALM